MSTTGLNEQGLLDMTPDERINYLRGTVEDFPQTVEDALHNHVSQDHPEHGRILEAFRARVEQHLNEPGGPFGGSVLDHLAQGQEPVIDQNTYGELNVAAILLAGSILQKNGFGDLANAAFLKAGQLMARNRKYVG